MQNILVLGGSGLVGKAIVSEMNNHKDFMVYATYFQHTVNQDRWFQLDIEDPTCIKNILNIVNPQIVISCLRGNFNDQLLLHTTIADYLRETGGRLYYFSTTNVFDYDLSKPHFEYDKPNSSSEYGQYKIACEKKITDILHDNSCIIRLPQVWGLDSPRKNNLINLLRNDEKIVVYPKLFCNMTTDSMIAMQLYYIIERKLNGIFHFAAKDLVNHKTFLCDLILGLGFNNVQLQENCEEEGYFALLSKRGNEFPDELTLTNNAVIDYLTQNHA